MRFITFTSFSALVIENGLEFHPIQGNAQSLVANAGANTFALIRSFGSLADSYARDLSAPHLLETDLIINQLPIGLFGFDLAEKAGIPQILASVIPLARTSTLPLMGFPKLLLPGYNQATYRLGEQLAWQMFRPAINRWRTRTLHLPALPVSGYFNQFITNQAHILNGFSPLVVPPPADWGDRIHVTGYWFPKAQAWQPPDELRAFLDRGPAPVFIGFGSMPVRNSQRTARIVLEALKQSGQRGILHLGWSGIGNLDLPKTVFKMDYAPYGWLFPQMALVIHHGGSGTTAYGLKAGVPSMAVPFVFDQFYWGARIAELGAGPRPIPYRRLSAERLAEAVVQGITHSQMQHQANELGMMISNEDGVEKAIQIIERFG